MMGIYKCVNENNVTLYVGSTGLPLSKLEWNHRNYYKFPDGYESVFRKQLKENGSNWTFHWLMHPTNITREHVEILEQIYISTENPQYNIDKRPYETSTKRGRNNGSLKQLLFS